MSYANNEFWAIIPARGGSRGVPGKNIKSLSGKPLISWAIDSLKSSSLFSKIIVSTDSDDIAEVAQSYGAEIEMRTDETESDSFTMPDAPVHSCLLKRQKKCLLPSHVFMIQCTSPFVKVKRYTEAAALSRANPESTIFSVINSHAFLWRRSNENETLNPLGHPFEQRLGRQYLNYEQYQETGAFYCFETHSFLKTKHRFNNSALPIVLEQIESLDIDTFDDWEMAEYYISKGYVKDE